MSSGAALRTSGLVVAAGLALAAAYGPPGAPVSAGAANDPRAWYDVDAYRIDLAVDPQAKRLSGFVAIEARVTAEKLSELVLDARRELEIQRVVELEGALEPRGNLDGRKLAFTRDGALLRCSLATARKRGDVVRIAVGYACTSRAPPGAFEGIHWRKTNAGLPWLSIACQGLGSSAWWPGKDSFFHPEDKAQRFFLNFEVPVGLYAVSNGRLASREETAGGETFHWVHEYPCETYAITLDVGPYVVVEQEIELPEIAEPVTFAYYVLPENAEKAALQFAEVPRMLAVYGEAFGPFPFPKSKFALVETAFWGMEHSTAVAYGSSYPAWIARHGGRDPHASRNELFDYILIHESAHEWWGNAVSARDWGHFWIHEGFATYAECVWVEKTKGRAAAQGWLDRFERAVARDTRLFRGAGVDSGAAYDLALYYKGAWVLHTLRHDLADDALWWKTLREFNLAYRYGNATTEDFRAVLERTSGRDWKRFFDEWFYGAGFPAIDGRVRMLDRSIVVELENSGTAETGFHVPLDLDWQEDGGRKSARVELAPGANRIEIPCSSRPRDVRVVGMEEVLGEHVLRVE